MITHPILLGFYEPGLKRPIQAGKVVQITEASGRAVWVYQLTVYGQDLMECLDAWGVAPCVLEFLIENGVEEIHYYAKEENKTYIATPEKMLREGIKQAHAGRGTYYHLPRVSWYKVQGKYAQYPWASQRVTLQWTEPEMEPEPAEAQMRMI